MKKLNVILRGHIRNSFKDKKLFEFLKELSSNFELNIFVQTWNIIQSQLSWRKLKRIEIIVSDIYIKEYLNQLDIKKILILDDSDILHKGRVEGLIGKTKCPILGWKNMWYGKIKGAEIALEDSNKSDITLQFRFDVFSNPYSKGKDLLIDFVEKEYEFLTKKMNPEERIRFLWMRKFVGVDNIYMARLEDINNFPKYIYENMDDLCEKYKDIKHQEFIAFDERKSFFEKKSFFH